MRTLVFVHENVACVLRYIYVVPLQVIFNMLILKCLTRTVIYIDSKTFC